MRTASLLLSFLAFIPVGCISSVKPLATDDIAAFDEELIGEWVDAHPIAEARRVRLTVTADGVGYKIETHSSRGEKESCSARLVQFGEVQILDCSLGKPFKVPSHQFFRLSVSNDILTLFPIDPKKFKEVAKSDEPMLAVEDSGNPEWTSKQLQDFFSRHSDDVFASKPIVWMRKVK